MRRGPRGIRGFRACPAVLIAFPLGFGPLFALISSKTDHLGPKTANLGPDPLPRPPTWAPGAAQDRPHRP